MLLSNLDEAAKTRLLHAQGIKTLAEREVEAVMRGEDINTFTTAGREAKFRFAEMAIRSGADAIARPGETREEAQRRAVESGKASPSTIAAAATANPLTSIFQSVSSVFTAPLTTLSNVFNSAVDHVSDFGRSVWNGMTNAWDNSLNFFSSLKNRAVSAFNNSAVGGYTRDLTASASQKMSAFRETASEMGSDVYASASQKLDMAGAKISGLAANFGSAVTSRARSLFRDNADDVGTPAEALAIATPKPELRVQPPLPVMAPQFA